MVSFADYRHMEAEKAIHQLRDVLGNLDRSLTNLRPGEKPTIPMPQIATLPDALETLVAMKERLSPSHQIKFDSLGLAQSYEFANSIIEKVNKHAVAE